MEKGKNPSKIKISDKVLRRLASADYTKKLWNVVNLRLLPETKDLGTHVPGPISHWLWAAWWDINHGYFQFEAEWPQKPKGSLRRDINAC